MNWYQESRSGMQRQVERRKGGYRDEAVKDTGYSRKYLIHKLSRMAFCVIRSDIGGKKLKTACKKKRPDMKGRRGRPREYDEALRASIIAIWYMFDMMCSNITSIAAYPPFHVTAEIEEKLIGLSPATADRLLRPEREKMQLRGKSGTRSPGASLNSLIPVRAYYSYAERNEAGCFEIDTVVHCGYGPQNDSLWTLSLTDVANGFIYIRPLRAKTQRYVLEALDDIAENTS